uniref:Uncharacterized protein n=1 Tax=Parascaris equorum TaxID=6256 RepID=A0A914RJE5_PAREQ
MIRHAGHRLLLFFLFFESSLRNYLNGTSNFELVHCFLFRTSIKMHLIRRNKIVFAFCLIV